ncbi:MAG: hypothetical protein EVA65_00930 [Oceanococcus sp.]|nr:MAG: hypothetical protein EVA65_00930 [Oceanococcus sp.]
MSRLSIYARRRANLRQMLDMGYDGSGYVMGVCLEILQPTLIDRLTHQGGPPISETFARFIEAKTQWPHGWLDLEPMLTGALQPEVTCDKCDGSGKYENE